MYPLKHRMSPNQQHLQYSVPANFLVWMASPEAEFLNGRKAQASWQVGKVMAQEEAIRLGSRVTSGIDEWHYGIDAGLDEIKVRLVRAPIYCNSVMC